MYKLEVVVKLSRPSRARGLKQRCNRIGRGFAAVAPLAGAWIEIFSS